MCPGACAQQVLGDSVLDYCARNYADYSENDGPGVLDTVKKVGVFRGYVGDSVGKLILTGRHRGFQMVGNFSELGVINGEVNLEVSNGFRNMYVPVNQVYVPKKGSFAERDDRRVIVSSDFFGPRDGNEGGHWSYSGSGSKVVGGSGCDDFCGNLYIGSKEEIARILNPASEGIQIKGSMSLPKDLK